MFGWFKKDKGSNRMIKPKRGFRISKKTRYVYEASVGLYYKDKRLGVIPIDIQATSRASATKMIQDEVEIKLESIHKSKRKNK